jgi:hypothetical protein
MSNLLNLSSHVNSEICESSEDYAEGDFPVTKQLKISITYGSFGLGRTASVLTVTCPFGSNGRHFADLEPAQVDRAQAVR